MTETLTDKVKQELAATSITRQSARAAELTAVLRFAGEVTVPGYGPAAGISADDVAYDVYLDSEEVAARVVREIDALFGIRAQILDIHGGHTASTRQGVGTDGRTSAIAKNQSIRVHVPERARELIRRLGLVTRSGHAVVGLPPHVISGGVTDNEAAWRGAFLARGSLTEPGRSSALEVECPCPEAALALVGCARRLNVPTKTKETRGSDRVVVRDGDAIGALLTRLGAQRSRLEWEEKRRRREARVTQNRLANFDDANLRRSARAAVTAAARVERAIAILGDEVPEHLADAGHLRIQHRQASLEELGRLADPPMTKDAVAGRIRRLLSMADKRAEELGIPDTNESVNDEIFD